MDTQSLVDVWNARAKQCRRLAGGAAHTEAARLWVERAEAYEQAADELQASLPPLNTSSPTEGRT